jgi:hypothetical protein
MPVSFLQIGSAPPPPTQLVGRENDLAKLKALLIQNPEKQKRGVVRLLGERVRQYRGEIATEGGTILTRSLLAQRVGLSEEVVKKAENNQLVRISTAAAIARGLGRSLNELTAPAGDSVALQSLVVVRGLPGVGKTTLVSALAHDATVKNAFEGCLWASLGQSPDCLAELTAWGRALGLTDIDREKAKKHARARLTALLSDRRLLLIIDDAWTSEDAIDLMVGGPLCATLMTTRLTEVANAVAPTEDDLYPLNVLTEDHSVKLLEELASSVVEDHRDEARELAQELECLPLALQVAGRLLRARARTGLGVAQLIDELRDASNLLDKDSPGGPKVAAILKKSTDFLDEKARKCFAYLASFADKPASFDLNALKDVWCGIPDDIEQMADLLVARGLLEPVGGGRFWLHALLVAHAKSLLASTRRFMPTGL